MKNVHTIPLHIGDLITDTVHLSPAEFGAYMRLLLRHYSIGYAGLPNDENQLRRITGLDNKTWNASKETILSYFELNGDRRWVHARVQKTLLGMAAVSEQNRNKALKRHNAHNAAAMQQQCSGSAEPMLSIIHNPESNIVGKDTKPKDTAKGTRFTLEAPPPEWINFCKAERSDLVPDEVFKRFRDYWISVTGKAATKRDWFATWRNWVRNERKETKAYKQTAYQLPERPVSTATEEEKIKTRLGVIRIKQRTGIAVTDDDEAFMRKHSDLTIQ